ncbi:MAG TPA: DUF6801 domain-containing protein [Streptosporangiaceae bacterium]
MVVVLGATGVAASGATPAIGWQVAKPALTYSCAFPSGPQPVSIQVAATFPATVPAGQPIQPIGIGISATLPRSVVSSFGSVSATMAGLSGALDVRVNENGTSAAAPWQHLISPRTPIPANGTMTAALSGTAPPVTVKAGGDVSFTASGLALLLSFYQADGRATHPSSMLVECALKTGQSAALATVVVTGGTNPSPISRITVGSQPGTSHTAAHHPASTKTCPPIPKKGLKLNPRFPPPKPPKGVREFHGAELACAYLAGFSDVRKLNESALIGPGLSKLDLAITVFAQDNNKLNYFQSRTAGLLDYKGKSEFPPARATLLAFGFVPVSATLQLSAIGTVNAITLGPEVPSQCKANPKACKGHLRQIVTISSRVSLGISDVTINGVPLNVGPHCGSAKPFDIILKGIVPIYSPFTGGPLTGSATIPEFKGCSDGTENLDTIFTASVSGSGNEILLTQGIPCFVVGATGCPPCKPVPLRSLRQKLVCPAPLGDTSTGRLHGN